MWGARRGEPEPAPTATVTAAETAEPETSEELQTQRALAAFEITGDVSALQLYLTSSGIDCPNEEPGRFGAPDPESNFLYCDPDQTTMLQHQAMGRYTEDRIYQSFGHTLEGGGGVVYTDHYLVYSQDPELLDAAHEALAPFTPERLAAD